MTPKQLHTNAMNLYFKAQTFKDEENYKRCMNQALDDEMLAIELLEKESSRVNTEPTLSILMESAIAMAIELRKKELAVNLAITLLYKNLDTPLKETFYDLLDKARNINQ